MNEQLASQAITGSDDHDAQTLGPEPYPGAYIVAGLERCTARIAALAPDVYRQKAGLTGAVTHGPSAMPTNRVLRRPVLDLGEAGAWSEG